MDERNWPEIHRAAVEERHEIHIDGSALANNPHHEGELPEILFQLNKLHYLELLHLSGVTFVPPSIGDLKQLTQLSLHHLPNLKSLPVEIQKLKSLKYLNLSYNDITDLPENILHDLTHLATLNLSNNKLKSVPDLSSLTGLQNLSLAANQLTVFPEVIASCPSLADVNLAHNLLTEFPDSVGDMPCLKEFNVEDNKLKIINPYLACCNKLKVLLLKGNESTLKDNRLRKLIADNKSGTNNNTSSILQYLKKQLPADAGKKKPKAVVQARERSISQKSTPVIRVIHSTWKSPLETENSDSPGDTNNTCQALSQCDLSSSRPYIILCILRDVHLGQKEDGFRTFIRYQDELHKSVCGDRKLATIATHDNDMVRYPLMYTTKLRDNIRITMLTSSVEESGLQLIHRLSRVADNIRRGDPNAKLGDKDVVTGVYAYAHQVRSQEYLSVVEDADNRVISLPPVTNCEQTKLTENTKNILLEVTGVQFDVCKKVCDTILRWVAEHNQSEELVVEQIRIMEAANPGRLKVVYPSRADFREIACQVKFPND